MAQDFPGLPGFPRVSPELALVPQGVSGFPRVPQGSPGCARVLAWFARVRPRFPGLPDFPALFPGFPGLAGSRRDRLAGSALPGPPCRVRLAGFALPGPPWVPRVGTRLCRLLLVEPARRRIHPVHCQHHRRPARRRAAAVDAALQRVARLRRPYPRAALSCVSISFNSFNSF